MDSVLELNQVCKTFGRSDFMLDRVSFSVPYGTIMGFVGENGAGKTTTIGCIPCWMFFLILCRKKITPFSYPPTLQVI